jgi:DNA-binding NarL/FixJ family response regulator
MEAAGSLLVSAGDLEAGSGYLGAARAVYVSLGARWDLARVKAIHYRCGVPTSSEAEQTPDGWASLADTEIKIATLVSRGLSTTRIAEHLALSRRTVQVHLSSILTKLGLHSRADLVGAAARRRAT